MPIENLAFDPRSIRGVGLRPAHYPHWHAKRDCAPWLEIMADNYLFQEGGPGLAHLDRIASHARCLVHGVGLSIAGRDPLDKRYLDSLRALCERVDARVVSDHLCFTRASGRQSYDLLPIPYTEQMFRHVADRIARVQDFLGRRLALENVSSYVSFSESECTEMEFLRALCDRTGCGILLDVNNVHVSAINHGHDARAEIARIDPAHVMQYHVAGHTERDGFLHDTHDQPVSDAVWDLCAHALACVGPRPFVLEYDGEGASADDLERELDMGLARVLGAISPMMDIAIRAPFELRMRAVESALTCETPTDGVVDEFAWQDEFLAVVQSPVVTEELLSRSPGLASRLAAATRARIHVYRLGYFSRVTATLAGTLFEKSSVLVGMDYMRGVLGRYFENNPATDPEITDSCWGLPAFAEGLEDVAEHVPWLPDFLRLCIARWDVLTRPDPASPAGSAPEPQAARLRADARLVVSVHPVFTLWLRAEEECEREIERCDAVSEEERTDADDGPESGLQSVLLFKSTPTDLEMVFVPPALVSFTNDLASGCSVAKAIECVEVRGDEIDAHSLATFLAALSRRHAWESDADMQ